MIGSGVLKGMAVVFRQFLGTYPVGRGLLKLLRQPIGDGLVTISYPEVKQQHSERFRYFPFLVYDSTPENLRCVACRICEQECPPQCIHIVEPKDEQGRPLKNQHGRRYPAQFDIDVSICMSCRICVDVCPFDAIEMDKEHELSGYGRGKEMNHTKERLLKSDEYFHQIRPEEAATVDKRLAAKKPKTSVPTQPSAPAVPTPPTPSAPT
jgi:NADH-quinone oxidoreductase subunit I